MLQCQPMNEQNKKIIQDAVKEVGLHLEGKLPEIASLKKRNSYAHLWHAIKERMGRSYKLCSDDEVPQILEVISYYRENIC